MAEMRPRTAPARVIEAVLVQELLEAGDEGCCHARRAPGRASRLLRPRTLRDSRAAPACARPSSSRRIRLRDAHAAAPGAGRGAGKCRKTFGLGTDCKPSKVPLGATAFRLHDAVDQAKVPLLPGFPYLFTPAPGAQ